MDSTTPAPPDFWSRILQFSFYFPRTGAYWRPLSFEQNIIPIDIVGKLCYYLPIIYGKEFALCKVYFNHSCVAISDVDECCASGRVIWLGA